MSSIGNEDIDTTGPGPDDARIVGLLDQYHWSAYAISVMSFAITDSEEDYEDSREGLINDYPDDKHEGVFSMPAPIVGVVFRVAAEFEKILPFALDNDQNDQAGARIRFGITTAESDGVDGTIASAHVPDAEDGLTGIDRKNWMSGDVFLDAADFTGPTKAGSLAHFALLHELGHAFGLKHGHESEEFDDDSSRGPLPAKWDSQEFSVMTYRSYVGATGDGVSNTEGHFAQTLMMLDIAALQYLYGADFTTENGDTTYRWNEKTGAFSIGKAEQWSPAANVVFMTIWDGGGRDTYDLSNYDTGVDLDLSPGGHVDFGTQTATLGEAGGKPKEARGNVFNALLHDGDLRSLIEDARTGDGDDALQGNVADNRLEAGKGKDTLFGGAGHDTLIGGRGADLIYGGAGEDVAGYLDPTGVDVTIRRIGPARDGSFSVTGLAEGTGDAINGVEGFLFGAGGDRVRVVGGSPVALYGEGGDDTLDGGAAARLLVGGRGMDELHAGDSPFRIYGGRLGPTGSSLGSQAENDLLVIDRRGSTDGYSLLSDERGGFGAFYDFDDSVAYGVSRIAFRGGAGDDAIDGGVGDDRIAAGDGRNLFRGDRGGDTAAGGSGVDTFYGDRGADSLSGGDGDDYLEGGEGDDTLNGEGGSDRIRGGNGDDRILTGTGRDGEAFGDAGDDTMIGSDVSETLDGGADNDSLSGRGGDDDLVGGGGDDTLDAGSGQFDVDGGAGVDTLIVDRSGDTRGFSFRLGGDFGSDGSRAIGVEHFAFVGGSGGDTVTAGAGTDFLNGGGGADRLNGGGGLNRLLGGGGDDVLISGAGDDRMQGGSGRDRFVLQKKFGDDFIADFDSNPAGGQDVIDLSAFGFRNFSAFRAAVTISGGDSAQIVFGKNGPELTLSGVAAASLGAADFLF